MKRVRPSTNVQSKGRDAAPFHLDGVRLPPTHMPQEKARNVPVAPNVFGLPEAPTYYPTIQEFADPLAYIQSIRLEAEQVGICKIVPPEGWNPPFSLDTKRFRFKTRIQQLNSLEGKTRTNLNYLEQLYKFHSKQGNPLTKVPQLDHRPIDLFDLRNEVNSRGGYQKVNKAKRWAEIGRIMKYDRKTCTSMSNTLKATYTKIIWPFEQYLAKHGGKLSESGTATFPNGNSSDEDANSDDPSGNKAEGSSKRRRRSKRRRTSRNRDFGAEDSDSALLDKMATPTTTPIRPNSTAVLSATSTPANGGNAEERDGKQSQSQDIPESCEVCKSAENDEKMLICDGCDRGFHMYCLNPPLSAIPNNDWYCDSCILGSGADFGFEDGDEYTLQSFKRKCDLFKRKFFASFYQNDRMLGADNRDPGALRGPTMEGRVPENVVEQEFWRLVASPYEDVEVEYGADLHSAQNGSGFPTIERNPTEPYARHPWNLNVMPFQPLSLFNYIKQDISGMKTPWIYVGMCFSTFCWHNEDHYTYSVNYMHWGDTKTWYGVPGHHAEMFEDAMRDAVPQLFNDQPDLLFQLVTMLSPEILVRRGVNVATCNQRAGEFVITFPQSYHAGFNQGFNFNEAVNFSTPDWMPFDIDSVLRYQHYIRNPVFSHDELLMTMCESGGGLITEPWLQQAVVEMANRELFDRHRVRILWPPGFTINEARWDEVDEGDPDMPEEMKQQCYVCKAFSYLSAVVCSCSGNYISCLKHAEASCKCTGNQKVLKYKYSDEDLTKLLEYCKGSMSINGDIATGGGNSSNSRDDGNNSGNGNNMRQRSNGVVGTNQSSNTRTGIVFGNGRSNHITAATTTTTTTTSNSSAEVWESEFRKVMSLYSTTDGNGSLNSPATTTTVFEMDPASGANNAGDGEALEKQSATTTMMDVVEDGGNGNESMALVAANATIPRPTLTLAKLNRRPDLMQMMVMLEVAQQLVLAPAYHHSDIADGTIRLDEPSEDIIPLSAPPALGPLSRPLGSGGNDSTEPLSQYSSGRGRGRGRGGNRGGRRKGYGSRGGRLGRPPKRKTPMMTPLTEVPSSSSPPAPPKPTAISLSAIDDMDQLGRLGKIIDQLADAHKTDGGLSMKGKGMPLPSNVLGDIRQLSKFVWHAQEWCQAAQAMLLCMDQTQAVEDIARKRRENNKWHRQKLLKRFKVGNFHRRMPNIAGTKSGSPVLAVGNKVESNDMSVPSPSEHRRSGRRRSSRRLSSNQNNEANEDDDDKEMESSSSDTITDYSSDPDDSADGDFGINGAGRPPKKTGRGRGRGRGTGRRGRPPKNSKPPTLSSPLVNARSASVESRHNMSTRGKDTVTPSQENAIEEAGGANDNGLKIFAIKEEDNSEDGESSLAVTSAAVGQSLASHMSRRKMVDTVLGVLAGSKDYDMPASSKINEGYRFTREDLSALLRLGDQLYFNAPEFEALITCETKALDLEKTIVSIVADKPAALKVILQKQSEGIEPAEDDVQSKTFLNRVSTVSRAMRALGLGNSNMEDVERVSKTMQWFQRCQSELSQRSITSDTMYRLMEEADNLGIDKQAKLYVHLFRAKTEAEQWAAKAESIINDESQPLHLREVSKLLEKGRNLAALPYNYQQLKELQQTALDLQARTDKLVDRSEQDGFVTRPQCEEAAELIVACDKFPRFVPTRLEKVRSEIVMADQWTIEVEQAIPFRETRKSLEERLAMIQYRLQQMLKMVGARDENNTAVTGAPVIAPDRYCVCLGPDSGLMVECDHCHEWYHPQCMNLAPKEVEDCPFLCPLCSGRAVALNNIAGNEEGKLRPLSEQVSVGWVERAVKESRSFGLVVKTLDPLVTILLDAEALTSALKRLVNDKSIIPQVNANSTLRQVPVIIPRARLVRALLRGLLGLGISLKHGTLMDSLWTEFLELTRNFVLPANAAPPEVTVVTGRRLLPSMSPSRLSRSVIGAIANDEQRATSSEIANSLISTKDTSYPNEPLPPSVSSFLEDKLDAEAKAQLGTRHMQQVENLLTYMLDPPVESLDVGQGLPCAKDVFKEDEDNCVCRTRGSSLKGTAMANMSVITCDTCHGHFHIKCVQIPPVLARNIKMHQLQNQMGAYVNLKIPKDPSLYTCPSCCVDAGRPYPYGEVIYDG